MQKIHSFIAGLLIFLSIVTVGCDEQGSGHSVTQQQPLQKTEIGGNYIETARLHVEKHSPIKSFDDIWTFLYLKDLNRYRFSQAVIDSFSRANALLNMGNPREASVSLERLTDNLSLADSTRFFYHLLAVSYLRVGELQNCVNNHTDASCIIPLKTDGIHQNPKGSLLAIGVYKKILNKYPDDRSAKWLLNLASITIGKYPTEIPPQYLLPLEGGNLEPSFAQFSNKAMQKKMGEIGLAGGCCVDDFNNDGHLDIVASSFPLDDQIHVFFNDGKGSFEDVTTSSGIDGITGGMNLIHGDYDNDGYKDIFVMRGGWLRESGKLPNSLLRNNGDGTFSDVTIAAGVLSFYPTQTAGWADFDSDGWLDLFIGNEAGWYQHNEYTNILNQDAICELYQNNGDGTFTNVASEVGLDVKAFVKGCTWGDINNDILPDLYLSVMGDKNLLFLNKGEQADGTWNFEDISESAGVQAPIFSFPTWFWDFDNDGWQDIFVSGYDTEWERLPNDFCAELEGMPLENALPKLYKNYGDNTFSEVSEEMGIKKPLHSMGGNFGDIDNDGYLDFYVGTGNPDFRSVVPNRMFKNNVGGSKSFTDVTYISGTGHIQKGHGIGFGDIDNDGDQDIYAVMGGFLTGDVFQNALFENHGNTNSWLTILLEGKTANRNAIGAKVSLIVLDKSGNKRMLERIVTTGGSYGASSLRLEVGLGNATKIEKITVAWPNQSQTTDTHVDVPLNSFIHIREGDSTWQNFTPKKL